MKKEQVLELMNAIPHDLVEEAGIQAPAKKRMPKIARTGLIAACLCLALIGTGAAAIANGWTRIGDISTTTPLAFQKDGQTVSITEVEIVSDGHAYVPWERFSHQSQEFASSFSGMPQYKGFDSWDELERFLGLDIFNNPVLDRAEPVTHDNTGSLGSRRLEGNCFAGFHGYAEAPDSVRLDAAYRFEDDNGTNYTARLNGFIPTHPSEHDEWNTGFGYTSFEIDGISTNTPITETYVTPSGLETVIVTFSFTRDTYCFAYFQLNHVIFDLLVYNDDTLSLDGPGANQSLDIVKEILDAFS